MGFGFGFGFGFGLDRVAHLATLVGDRSLDLGNLIGVGARWAWAEAKAEARAKAKAEAGDGAGAAGAEAEGRPGWPRRARPSGAARSPWRRWRPPRRRSACSACSAAPRPPLAARRPFRCRAIPMCAAADAAGRSRLCSGAEGENAWTIALLVFSPPSCTRLRVYHPRCRAQVRNCAANWRRVRA